MNQVNESPASLLSIHGAVTLSYGDVIAFQIVRLPKFLAIFLLVEIVAFVCLWLVFLSPQGWERLSVDLMWGVKDWFAETGVIIAISVVAIVVILFLSGWVSFYRMPKENRMLSIEVDADAIRTCDEAKAALTIPWTMVRKTQLNKRLLILRLSSSGWRFVPLRAFAPDDRDRVIALAKQHSGQ